MIHKCSRLILAVIDIYILTNIFDVLMRFDLNISCCICHYHILSHEQEVNRLLTRIYTEYCPSKVNKIDRLLDKYEVLLCLSVWTVCLNEL